MVRPLRRLRTLLDARVKDWLRRRQGVDRDPVMLHRRRIYILPTRLGLAYAAMLFAMLVGGMNYNNNLGLAMAFLLAGLGLVAMLHCHGTLRGIELRLASTHSAFAGQSVAFGLLLENRAQAPRPQVELAVDGPARETADLPAGSAITVHLAVAAPRRGRIPLERFVVATCHPLGLFRAWAVVHPGYTAVAWPKPAERGRTPPGVATDTGGAQHGMSGDEDFAGLRPYQDGDSPRRVAWKAYARGQGLHTKQYAGTEVVSHVFDWESLPGLAVEARLAQLCRWIVDAHEHGEAFGLRLPGLTIEPNIGTAHREHCLNALALFEAAPGHG